MIKELNFNHDHRTTEECFNDFLINTEQEEVCPFDLREEDIAILKEFR